MESDTLYGDCMLSYRVFSMKALDNLQTYWSLVPLKELLLEGVVFMYTV